MTSKLDVQIPEPHYSIFDTERGDLPAVVVVNGSALSFTHREIFPWHLEIVIQAEDISKNGMPTHVETEMLDSVGDAIESALLRATTAYGSVNALFLARVTCDSRRELCYRIHDAELANSTLRDATSVHSYRQWTFSISRDDSWSEASIYEDLFDSVLD